MTLLAPRLVPLLVVVVAALGCKKEGASIAEVQKSSPPSAMASNVAPSPSSSSSSETIVGRRVDVDVGEHGFTPNEVSLKKGEPTTLVFTRTSNSTCAFEVVFPELKITKDLPLKKPVPIAVPTDDARVLTFQCGMGMYKSKVVVQ